MSAFYIVTVFNYLHKLLVVAVKPLNGPVPSDSVIHVNGTSNGNGCS